MLQAMLEARVVEAKEVRTKSREHAPEDGESGGGLLIQPLEGDGGETLRGSAVRPGRLREWYLEIVVEAILRAWSAVSCLVYNQPCVEIAYPRMVEVEGGMLAESRRTASGGKTCSRRGWL